MEIVLFLVFTRRGPKVREAELARGKTWTTHKKERDKLSFVFQLLLMVTASSTTVIFTIYSALQQTTCRS